MTDYDWGDRQERVNYLLKCLVALNPEEVNFKDLENNSLTNAEVIEHIKRGSEVGRSIVALAGLALQAKGDPLPNETMPDVPLEALPRQ